MREEGEEWGEQSISEMGGAQFEFQFFYLPGLFDNKLACDLAYTTVKRRVFEHETSLTLYQVLKVESGDL